MSIPLKNNKTKTKKNINIKEDHKIGSLYFKSYN